MSAEFCVGFESDVWLNEHRSEVENRIATLSTFVRRSGRAFWLQGIESRSVPDARDYDVRIFLDSAQTILVEVSAHPATIERELTDFLAWLRSHTSISMEDEDGEPSNWCK
ncbi:hypothetical protein [Montanilutibacter psychrotolerans]|uniref:hypothetical protein n=1 Tax=Montanilutibacter psychrotolerans TaxID=1327343 RepID=UPI0011CD8A6B|nr:hypothetical protein [Lysobacter psychrotolerans]